MGNYSGTSTEFILSDLSDIKIFLCKLKCTNTLTSYPGNDSLYLPILE